MVSVQSLWNPELPARFLFVSYYLHKHVEDTYFRGPQKNWSEHSSPTIKVFTFVNLKRGVDEFSKIIVCHPRIEFAALRVRARFCFFFICCCPRDHRCRCILHEIEKLCNRLMFNSIQFDVDERHTHHGYLYIHREMCDDNVADHLRFPFYFHLGCLSLLHSIHPSIQANTLIHKR